jgi:glycosyltransferase involved in cell wall biosynthesis
VGTRLLILTPTDDRGGAEEYLLTIAGEAVKRDWEVVVGFELSARTGSIADELRSRPQTSYVDAPIRDWHRWRVTGQALATARLLRRSRADVAMIVLPWPTRGLGCVIATALASLPTAVVFQLAPWPLPTRSRRRAGRWAQRRRQQWIAVSDQNREAIEATFAVPPGSVRTIYNGAPDVVRLSSAQSAAARRALRTELGLAGDARVVLTVGRLTDQKGYTDLLEGIPTVLTGRPDLFFVWIGDGELRAELESVIRRRELEHHVRVLGHRQDVGQILDGADVFLLPSRFEGHSFALVEALAHGTPAVSSDAGGAPEIIRDGIDGLVFRRRDPADLAHKLSWAIDHPQEMAAMGASGRDRAAAFSQSQMLQQTFAALAALRDR